VQKAFGKPMIMAVREMVANWIGASRAYERKYPKLQEWTWLIKNRSKLQLHKQTEVLVEQILKRIL